MLRSIVEGRFLSTVMRSMASLLSLVFRALDRVIVECPRIFNKLGVQEVDAWLANQAKSRLVKRSRVSGREVLLVAMQGEYTDNLKYICEELLKRDAAVGITWAAGSNAVSPLPENISFVRAQSYEYFSAAATAKVIVQNGHTLQKDGVQKHAEQYWLQTWHGSLGLKRLEGAGGDFDFYKRMRDLQSVQTDYLLSNSGFEEKVFESTYWPGVRSLRTGHARNDVLFDDTSFTQSRIRKLVLARLGVTDYGQKFFLVAPTHGDGSRDFPFASLDFGKLRTTLAKKFGGEWEFLIRVHNNERGRMRHWLSGLPLFCHNASPYPDMQELLVVAAAGVSDYSSWVCDYIITKKPSFLFGVDMHEFSQKRGFYHAIDETPFTLALTQEQLMQQILSFDQAVYERKIVEFFSRCEFEENGRSAARVVDEILKLLGDEQKESTAPLSTFVN